ncbi:hypothetical protein BDD12DRAFT_561818 [Trichophaea hybrida]|nr:hypothetical protein BDD12DRAFT_561818 [Trichophaea hybrida]
MAFTAHANSRLFAHNALLSIADPLQQTTNSAWVESIKTAPIFTSEAGKVVDTDKNLPGYKEFGLLGQQIEILDSRLGTSDKGQEGEDGRIFLNADAPHSAFICGVQGAGKSNTLGCMLGMYFGVCTGVCIAVADGVNVENYLLPSKDIGELPAPLTGLVFHYDQHTPTPCEVAYLTSHIPVTVLVPPSSLNQATALYSKLPGASGKLTVRALRLREQDLNVSRMLTLMAVDRADDKPPLYMEIVRKILRNMANSVAGFQYKKFKQQLDLEDLTPGQRCPLNLRLEILESFMAVSQLERSVDLWDIDAGRLVVVDLSDPFVDEATACSLFDICLNLFLDRPPRHGKVIALDEAHKYMTVTAAAQKFTDTLLSTIRQQRHLGARVIISTQEPTISPKLLDLCTFTLCHRFSSPEWLGFLKAHIAAAGQEEKRAEMMARLVALDSGEAFLFAPSGIMMAKKDVLGMLDVNTLKVVDEDGMTEVSDSEDDCEKSDDDGKRLEKFGLKYMKVKIRKRITQDGGRSVMAVS